MFAVQAAFSRIGSADTSEVAPRERLGYWESYNRTALVGLRCTTYVPEGLAAEQTNFVIDDIRLADIRGNAHVVERTPELVDARPKDSLFASIIVEGSAYFYSRQGCHQVHAGDVIVYNTLAPYLFAFGTAMRQLLIDIPCTTMFERFGNSELIHPVVADPRWKGAEALLSLLNGARDIPDDSPELTTQTLLDAVGVVSGLTGDLAAIRVQKARRFIDHAVCDGEFTAADVARAVGVTLRHLNRACADSGTSVSRMIREQRLDRAIDDLHTNASMNIADIAAKWGFSSHAQFSTAVRRRHGVSPIELRRREVARRLSTKDAID